MKVYKGTDKNMRCRGMQYTIGKTETAPGAVRCGNVGLHSCEAPFDVLKYYPMRDGNRYFAAEAAGKIDRTNAKDSKIASSELTIKSEISFANLFRAQVEYTRSKAQSGTAGGNWSNLAGGDESNLAGGDRSNLAGGNESNLAGGNWSNLAGGDRSLIVGRHGSRAKGGIDSVIVLSEWGWMDDAYKPVCVKAEIVDGVRIKADTWYELRDGEFSEIEE